MCTFFNINHHQDFQQLHIMTEELNSKTQSLEINEDLAQDLISMLDRAQLDSSYAQVKLTARNVSDALLKSINNNPGINSAWRALLEYNYFVKEIPDLTASPEFLYLLIDSSPKIKSSFIDFINGQQESSLAGLYGTFLTHSDKRFQALLLCFSSVKPDYQLKFVDLALESLKSKRTPTKLTELQLVSRYYLHLTKETVPSIFFRSKTLSIISAFADRRLSHDLISQVVMIIAKMTELDEDTTQRDLVSVVEDYILQDTNYSLIIAFSLTAILFHINANLGFSVFTIESILKQDYDQRHFLSEQVVTAALDLLSAACVHKESRAQVKANFLPVVKKALTSSKKSVIILASSILVKTNYIKEDLPGQPEQEENIVNIASLSLIFEEEISTRENIALKDIYGAALEGLAYTSLLPEIKARIISDKKILESLVDVIVKHYDESPWVFCALSSLANLTSYAPKISADQQKLKKLKDYANKSKADDDLVSEPDSRVATRCRIVLDTPIIDALSKNCPRFTLVSRNTASILLRNLATERKDRAVFAQKGGLTVLLYLVLPSDKPDQYGNKHKVDDKHLCIALSGLSRTLISIDPSLALTSKLTPSVTVIPLLSQLQNEASDVPLLDTFEALLALTNVASVDDGCRNLIIRHGWSKIETLITVSNSMVQRAAIELLCNLATSPLCAEKFLDNSPAANSRLEVLSALTDLEDPVARSAACGALAMLSEWGPAAAIMRSCSRLTERLIAIVDEETSDDVLIRALVVLQNLIVASTAEKTEDLKAREFLEALKIKGLNAGLAKLATRTKDPDVVGMSSETYKILSS